MSASKYKPWQKILFFEQNLGILLVLIILGGGWAAWNSMPQENNPDLNIPQALIVTEWSGASAEQIEKQVTQKIENKVTSIKGMKRVESGSYNSFSMTAVEFGADENIMVAMSNLRAKVDEAQADFPANVKKPNIEQLSVNGSPVVSYMLYGDNLDNEVLQQAAKALKKRLETLADVREVDIAGEREITVYVRMYPERLSQLGVSPVQVMERLQTANSDAAWGRFEHGTLDIELYFSSRFDNIEQLKQLAITRPATNRIVRLNEVALVERRLAKEKVKTAFSVNGEEFKRGVTLEIKKSSGGDTIALIDSVKRFMKESRSLPEWPHGMQAYKITDESEIILDSLSSILGNVWQASLIVFIILFFLLSWREAVIAGLAIPLSLVAALGISWMIGSTFNQMVIIGMVLALGMLVDVFILVMEGMHDALYVRGMHFKEAAVDTVKTYFKPAFAGQLTTILALTPLLAVGGIDGKFIRLIPSTTIISLVTSFVIAFLVCIPLSRYLLDRPNQEAKPTLIDRLTAFLGKLLLNWLEKVPLAGRFTAFLWMMGAVIIMYLSFMAVAVLPVEMYPKEDSTDLGILIELEPSVGLKESEQVAETLSEYLRGQKNIKDITRYIGQKSPLSTSSLKENILPTKESNLIGFSVTLVDEEDRSTPSYEYLPNLKKGLEKASEDVAGASIIFTSGTNGPSPDDPIQIRLIGQDIKELMDMSQQVRVALAKVPGATDIRDNVGPFRDQVRFIANQEALSFHKLSESDLARQIRFATEFDEIGKFKVEGVEDDYPIRLGTYWSSREKRIGGPKYTDEMQNLRIITGSGESVPLGSLVRYEIKAVPQVYVHTDAQRTITVRAKTEGTTALEVLNDLKPIMEEMKKNWPIGYSYNYGGEAESTDETFGNMGIAFIAAVLMIFTVLTLLFNSFKQPIVILITIPLAVSGTFTGFFLTGMSLSFPAIIGLITLVGIVVNNAIVMVETINSHRANGMPGRQAAARGAADRLRPIIATSITTVSGLIPLALSQAMWYPLCMAIIYGLIFSTLVSLIIVPTFFYLLEGNKILVKPNN